MALQAAWFVVGANGCPSELAGNQAWDKGSATRAAALDDAVEGIPSAGNEGAYLASGGAVPVEGWRVAVLERSRIKAEGVPVAFAISAVEAQTQAEVESKFLGDPPIILEVGFDDVVAVVVFGLKIDLRILSDFTREQVGKRVSGAGDVGIA